MAPINTKQQKTIKERNHKDQNVKRLILKPQVSRDTLQQFMRPKDNFSNVKSVGKIFIM